MAGLPPSLGHPKTDILPLKNALIYRVFTHLEIDSNILNVSTEGPDTLKFPGTASHISFSVSLPP